ncbi:MAG: FAD-dependent oxidoreductase [Eubacterium sp.]|nr:FAD-dependent oxidoreductase [Eubacterium sp.]
MREYQAAVIGDGPGGYIAAIQCAQRGLKTVLVEKRNLGGTCLNRGCIPTKTLLHSAEVYHEIKESKSLGIEIDGEVGFKYKKIAKRKDKVVKQLRSGVEYLVTNHGADIVNGEAVLTGTNTFAVGEEEFKADKIILAAGSAPAQIPIPGADQEGVLNSDSVLELTECPASVTIIGGGVIGVEFATLFADLGTPVTIVEMLPSILAGNDPDICSTMTYLLEGKGVTIHTGAAVKEIRSDMSVVFEKDGETQETAPAANVIMAIGRRPETAALNLKAAGRNIKVGRFDLSGNGRSLAVNSADGFVKLIADVETDEVIGCHIIGAYATEMIGEATVAIQNKLTAAQVGNTIHAHPTVSESIMEAAHDIHGLCCHKA